MATEPDKNDKQLSKEAYQWVWPSLQCNMCSEVGLSPQLSFGNDQYYNDCKKPSFWFHNDFVSNFGALLNHSNHDKNVMYLDCTQTNGNLSSPPKNVNLTEGVEKIVSMVHDVNHYCTVLINIDLFEVVVFDGLGNATSILNRWHKYIVYILQRCNLSIDRFVQQMRVCTPNDYGGVVLKQSDSSSCGPICCMCAWYVFEPTKAPIYVTQFMYRPAIVNKLLEMYKVFSDKGDIVCFSSNPEVYVEPSLKSEVEVSCDDSGGFEDQNEDTFADAEAVLNFINTMKKRKEQDAKRKVAQEKQGKKMMRLRSNCVKVQVGDIVRLYCPKDFKSSCMKQDLYGVVASVLEETKSIIVATKHGVIIRNTPKGPRKYIFSVDQYEVLNDLVGIPSELCIIRKKISEKANFIQQATCITYKSAYDQEWGARSKRKKNTAHTCTCKGVCKPKVCGCKKKGLSCHKKCACGGKCF